MVIFSIADSDTDDSIAPMGLFVQGACIAIATHETEVGGSQLDCLGVDMPFRHCGGMVVGLQRQAVIDKGVPVVCRGEIDGAVVARRNIEVVGFQMQLDIEDCRIACYPYISISKVGVPHFHYPVGKGGSVVCRTEMEDHIVVNVLHYIDSPVAKHINNKASVVRHIERLHHSHRLVLRHGSEPGYCKHD